MTEPSTEPMLPLVIESTDVEIPIGGVSDLFGAAVAQVLNEDLVCNTIGWPSVG
ncbi:MAG: hypothetical protein AB1941_14505 [Gemmatimonadota bacterium]